MSQCKDNSISNSNSIQSRNPILTKFQDNSILLNWVENSTLYGRSLGLDGIPIGISKLFATNGALNINYATIVELRNKNVLVVTPKSEIYAQKFAVDGTAQGAVFKVNSGNFSGYNGYNVEEIKLGNGKIAISWHVQIDIANNRATFARFYDENGNAIGQDTKLINNFTPVYLMSLDNNTMLASYYNSNIIYTQKIYNNGTVIGTPIEAIKTLSGSLGETPKSLLLENNQIVISTRYATTADNAIYAQTLDYNLNKVGAGYTIAQGTLTQSLSDNLSVPALTAASGNAFLVTYVITTVKPNVQYANLFAQKMLSNGTKVGNAFKINEDFSVSSKTYETLYEFDVISLNNNNTLFVWSGEEYDKYLPIQEQVFNSNNACINIGSTTPAPSEANSIHIDSIIGSIALFWLVMA